ncbi:DUF6221 family protein [Streptosporangium jomthongense]|uniref:DUF6221 family protein n=1 Tax=Streptosporangium jomthongense TaxID=1193683 RepID=A0ABV8FET7_9ACTN
MIQDLIAFIRARLDEDEELASTASPAPWSANAEHDEVLAADGITVADGFALSGRQLRATVNHIVRHDPARVLADVEADRKLLARYAEAVKEQEEALAAFRVARDEWESSSEEYADAYKDWSAALLREGAFLTVIKDRVARFPDHPDYRPEWKP